MLYSLAHPVSPTSRYDCEDGEDVLPDVSAFLYRPTAVHSIYLLGPSILPVSMIVKMARM